MKELQPSEQEVARRVLQSLFTDDNEDGHRIQRKQSHVVSALLMMLPTQKADGVWHASPSPKHYQKLLQTKFLCLALYPMNPIRLSLPSVSPLPLRPRLQKRLRLRLQQTKTRATLVLSRLRVKLHLVLIHRLVPSQIARPSVIGWVLGGARANPRVVDRWPSLPWIPMVRKSLHPCPSPKARRHHLQRRPLPAIRVRTRASSVLWASLSSIRRCPTPVDDDGMSPCRTPLLLLLLPYLMPRICHRRHGRRFLLSQEHSTSPLRLLPASPLNSNVRAPIRRHPQLLLSRTLQERNRHKVPHCLQSSTPHES